VSTLDVQPAPAAEPTSAVPIAQQVEGLTPAEAKTRLSELTHDKDWGAKFISAKPGSGERNLFDALSPRQLPKRANLLLGPGSLAAPVDALRILQGRRARRHALGRQSQLLRTRLDRSQVALKLDGDITEWGA